MQIDIRHHTLGYDDSGGTGIPLVLLHGFPLNRTIWTAQQRGLSDIARVLAPDLRGFGESSPTRDGTATVDDIAADIDALLETFGIGSAVVAGLSMGGFVALALHRLRPSRIRALVLVDTRSGPDSPEARKGRDEAIALVRKEGARALARVLLPKMLTPAGVASPMGRALLDLMAAARVEGIAGALAAIRDRPDAGPGLARIAVPTLVVTGADDTLIPPSESEALRVAIRGARLEVLPGAGHLSNYERPDAFNAVVRDFLSGLA
jgi:3-oxoadipate enol-lactonase